MELAPAIQIPAPLSMEITKAITLVNTTLHIIGATVFTVVAQCTPLPIPLVMNGLVAVIDTNPALAVIPKTMVPPPITFLIMEMEPLVETLPRALTLTIRLAT